MKETNKKCLVIYNPMSGKGTKKKVLEAYYKILKDKGYDVNIIATTHSNHATETISSVENYDIVFSIGGDGTLNEVVRGNYLRKNKLTICPLPNGTCNDVASMLGYGNNPIENLNMALDGEIHNIDIGTINDTPFAYVVGMGKFMNIPYETKSEEKHKNGYLAYIKNGIEELLDKMKRYQAEVTIDGKKLDGKYSLIMISNSNHIAGINSFHKEVYLNDGLVEILLCKSKNQREFIINFIKYLLGIKSEDIISLKGNEISIKFIDKPEKNWCIDGEEYSYTGTEYNIKINEEMKFLTPKNKVRKLLKVKRQITNI